MNTAINAIKCEASAPIGDINDINGLTFVHIGKTVCDGVARAPPEPVLVPLSCDRTQGR